MRKSILIIALVFLSSVVHAQSVVGVTAILGSTSSSEVDAYSATEIDYVVANSYQPYVEGYLCDERKPELATAGIRTQGGTPCDLARGIVEVAFDVGLIAGGYNVVIFGC